MSNKKLAVILGCCIAVITAIVIIAAFPPASGEPDENTAFHINVIPEQRTENQDPLLLYCRSALRIPGDNCR